MHEGLNHRQLSPRVFRRSLRVLYWLGVLVHLTMRTIMIAVSLVGCGAKAPDKADAWHTVDLALLGGVGAGPEAP